MQIFFIALSQKIQNFDFLKDHQKVGRKRLIVSTSNAFSARFLYIRVIELYSSTAQMLFFVGKSSDNLYFGVNGWTKN